MNGRSEAARRITDCGEEAQPLVRAARLAQICLALRRSDRVCSTADREQLRNEISRFDFSTAIPAQEVAQRLAGLLRRSGVRSDHPRYFGLFNPPALPEAIAGDLIAAALNPQLAVWSNAPAAAEIELHLVQTIGGKVWAQDEIAGVFTGGGSEANHTALLCALASHFPHWSECGVPSIGLKPSIFVSSEAHLAWLKIARAVGLGTDGVRLVPAGDGLRLTGDDLARAIDMEPDRQPILVVATAGTTAHGAIDDLEGLAAVARRHGAYVHVDAAWAGALLLHPERRSLLEGIEQADSVTIDPDKWLSVPMGCGIFLAREWTNLGRAFDVSTGYMPSASHESRDPYLYSLQWSRRFNGAKLFTALAALGLGGYSAMIERSFLLAGRLRARLKSAGFDILNATELPVVCFAPKQATDDLVQRIQGRVCASGSAWLSTVRLRGRLALRACITSFETAECDVDCLVEIVLDASGRPEAGLRRPGRAAT